MKKAWNVKFVRGRSFCQMLLMSLLCFSLSYVVLFRFSFSSSTTINLLSSHALYQFIIITQLPHCLASHL